MGLTERVNGELVYSNCVGEGSGCRGDRAGSRRYSAGLVGYALLVIMKPVRFVLRDDRRAVFNHTVMSSLSSAVSI